MNLTQLLIIADDLTGALDAAAPFCSADRKVVVATNIDALPKALISDAHIVAVSTCSREETEQIAFDRTQQAVKLASGARIFLKIDSRLKGNLISNLKALGDNNLLIAPAIPAFGRTVSNGVLTGLGIESPINIASKLGPLSTKSAIPDTTSDAHLDAVLKQFPDHSLVGARGLASAVARSLGAESVTPQSLEGRTGAAIGSTDPITLAQIEKLDPDRVDMLSALGGRYTLDYRGTRNLLLQATGAVRQNQSVVSRALAESFKPLAAQCKNLIISGGATAETVLQSLGVDILLLEGELLPGIPVSSASGWRIVTKSGGFGDPDTLKRLIQVS